MYSINKITLIIVAATLIVSCSNKNNTITPADTTSNVAPYKNIDGDRMFDGIKTSSTKYWKDSTTGFYEKYDTFMLKNIKINFTSIYEKSLLAVCKDSMTLIDNLFHLYTWGQSEQNDSLYTFRTSIGTHINLGFLYNVNTDKVSYSYTEFSSGASGSSHTFITLEEQ